MVSFLGADDANKTLLLWDSDDDDLDTSTSPGPGCKVEIDAESLWTNISSSAGAR